MIKTCPVCGAPNDAAASMCIGCGSPLQSPLPRIDKYDFHQVLGSGGFGITYLATDQNTGRKGVLKEFFPAGSRRNQDGSVQLPDGYNLDEVLQEARVLARLKHESINMCYTAERLNGTAYLFLEFIEGKDLVSVYRSGILNFSLVKSILLDLLHALDYVHSQGFLHLDLKPENILMSDGRPVLIDFGSAVLHGSQSSRVVTHGYSAPEQYSKGLTLGTHTDFYALGGVVYYLLTGRVPPSAVARMGGEDQDSSELVQHLPEGTPATLREVVQQCLALPISRRPALATDLLVLFGVSSKLQQKTKPQNQSQEDATYRMALDLLGTVPNPKEAAGLFELAARKGHLPSAYRLGELYLLGAGVKQDFYEAFHWANQAAEGGHPEAQFRMGWLCFYGAGTFKSIRQATQWFQKAAEQGQVDAVVWLGKLHLLGRGVPRDLDRAFQLFRQAAIQQSAEGEFQLGTMYLQGLSVNANPARALYWLERAAVQDHPQALFQLGKLYRSGVGGTTDLIRARECFLRALMAGLTEAEQEL